MRLVHMPMSSLPRTTGFNVVVSVFSAVFSHPGADQAKYISPLDTHIWIANFDTTNPDGRICKSDMADNHPNKRDVTKYVSRVESIYHLTAFGSSCLAFLFCFHISKGSQH